MAIPNETKVIVHEGKRFAVRRGRIIGTKHLIYDVFEPTKLGVHDGTGHSSITSNIDIGDTVHTGFWGQLGMRDLTPEIDALPVDEKRFTACRKFREEQYRLAHKLIMQVFPEAKMGTPHESEISLTEDN